MPSPSNGSCSQPAGVVYPVIDRNRCEGKAECVAVCPVEVFEIGVLAPEARRELSFKGKVKGFAHSWRQAFAVREAACEACGLCVKHCPEGAIKLVNRGA
ncbi:MAG: 4Fe-4S binding protein [Steroidobacteraceae bacterium]